MKPEWLARVVLASLTGLTTLIAVLGWSAYRDRPTLRARMPEGGGWDPAALSATVDKPLHLRLTSEDVAHSFAVGRTDWPAVDILPGEVSEVSLIFERPGKYVFYCTRWCGPNHWRMRGTIEVAGEQALSQEPVAGESPALYLELNLDIDAPHPAAATPEASPSAAAGDAFLERTPAFYRTTDYLRSHSPAQVWQALQEEPFAQALSDRQVWDLVAALWREGATPEQLAQGAALYAQNCAACHGEKGAGDGVFANQVMPQEGTPAAMAPGHETQSPTDFTDPASMLGASPALLQGKIVRGGMGTGMPYWGPIFTDEQTWAVVNYLYTFQFDAESER